MVWQNYLAIILFLIMSMGFGVTLNHFFKFTQRFDKILYKKASLLVIGFAFYALILYAVGILGIPLHFWIFFVLSLIVPAIKLFDKKTIPYIIEQIKKPKFSWQEGTLLLLIIVFLYLMLSGHFAYPWLEDDDPWDYAIGAQYVATFNDYHTTSLRMVHNSYLFPHSHSMLTVMYGMMNQITPDLYSIMKIYLNVILAFAVIAIFLFSYVMSNKDEIFSLLSVIILMSVPSFAGHFIFNYTLAVSLFVIFLFSLSLGLKDWKSTILAGIVCGSVLVAHPVVGIQAGVVLGLYALVALITELVKNKSKFLSLYKESVFLKIITIGLLGILFSQVYYADFFVRGGFSEIADKAGNGAGPVSFNYVFDSYDIEDKSLGDFFKANSTTRMDQQEGIGYILFSLSLIGVLLFFMLKKKWYTPNLMYAVWFLFYFIFLWLLTGGAFNFSVQNYRWWSVFAVFVALHAAATLSIILKLFKKEKMIGYIVIGLLLAGIFWTSAIPRYENQRAQWGPGADFVTPEEVNGYVGLRDIGFNEPMLGLCNLGNKIAASNQYTPVWEEDMYKFIRYWRNLSNTKELNYTINTANGLMDKYDLKYIILDTSCVKFFGAELSNQLVQSYGSDPNFRVRQEFSNQGFFLFEKV